MARPIRPWFRFYVEAFPDRKIRRLKPAQRWVWVAILGAARESHEPGRLYVAPGLPMSVAELADYAGVSEREARSALDAMKHMSMITEADGLLSVANWHKRQFESDNVTERTRDHRERSREQDRNVPGNASECGRAFATETETETEKTSSASADAEREFEEWYAAYPRKRGKGQAAKAYRAARKKADATTLLAAVQQQAPTLTARGPEFCPHPATWLNGERWDDEPDNVRRLPPGEGPDDWMRRTL